MTDEEFDRQLEALRTGLREQRDHARILLQRCAEEDRAEWGDINYAYKRMIAAIGRIQRVQRRRKGEIA